jgi:hypothetical protein
MRIAIVTNEFLSDAVQNAAHAKSSSLADRGHDVYLLYPDRMPGQRSFDGKVRLLGIGSLDGEGSSHDEAGWTEHFSSEVAEALEALDLVVQLDVVEFPDHGYEGHAYVLHRDSRSRFPVIVQNRGPLPAFASSLGKSQLVFQPSLPPDVDSWEGSHSSLALLKAETFYHFAVNRAHSRVVDSVEAMPA